MKPIRIRFKVIYLNIFTGYIMHYVVDPAKKCVVILTVIQLYVRILFSKWDIRANINLRETSLLVGISARENHRITIQIL